MSKPFTVVCTFCEGDGQYETTHPMWGSPSCPEAYVLITCEECEGDGCLPYERAALIDHLTAVLTIQAEADFDDMAEAVVAKLEQLGILPEAR